MVATFPFPRVRLLRILLGLLLMCAWSRPAASQPAERLRLVATPGDRAYVGQAIALRLELPASARSASLRWPAVDGARIEFGPPVDPIAEGAPGVHAGVLVVERSGALVIPAVRAQDGERAWISNPLRLEIRPVPGAGRPATFTGGVGPARLEARWSQPSVRQGDVAVLTITARGDGVVGQDRPFSVVVASGSPSARIGRADVETSLIPPVRIERFPVRALEPGQLRFEPLLGSTFDPVAERFFPERGTIAPLEVRPLPEPPGASENAAGSRADGQPWWASAGWTVVWALGPLAALALVVFVHRRARRADRPGPWLARARTEARSWPASEPTPTFARRILALLAEVLRGPDQGGGAVLTPDDARHAWFQWLGDDGLARDAEGLVARCESALYAGPGTIADDPKAWNEARRADLEALLKATRENPRHRMTRGLTRFELGDGKDKAERTRRGSS